MGNLLPCLGMGASDWAHVLAAAAHEAGMQTVGYLLNSLPLNRHGLASHPPLGISINFCPPVLPVLSSR